MARLRRLDPALCVSNLRERFPIRRDTDFLALADALGQAGLPEQG
jgi:hypothetical protein